MKKIVKIIKNNLFGFIVGAIVFGGVGVAYAANVLSSDVSYSNTNSHMGASNVSDALDELYEMANSGGGSGELYWTYDVNNGRYYPFYTSASSLMSGTNEHVYLKLQSNNQTAQVCLNLNNEEICLSPNEYETSANKLTTYFSSNCNGGINHEFTECFKDSFACYASDDGYVSCYANCNNGADCHINSNGEFECESSTRCNGILS